MNKTFSLLLIYWISAAVQAGPFQNGGFESPDSLASGEEQVLAANDTSIVGWRTGGPAGSVSRIKNGVEVWRSHGGEYVVGFEKGKPPGGWIEQSFDTEIGKTYQVSLFYLPLLVPDQGMRFGVEVFSQSGESIAVREGGIPNVLQGEWQRFTAIVTFTATTAVSTFRIMETGGRTATIRFDDVRIETVNAQMNVGLYPGITVTGLIGRAYAIEYKNSVNAPTWTTLKAFHLQQSPTLVFDEEGIQHPERIYRVTLLP